MIYFFIRFTYDHYSQGYEVEQETLLVQAINFESACDLIENK